GIGIPKDVKAKLFSPLVTTKAQGMGFGLAICKRIIDAHQGTITIESQAGKGTTITIKLPMKPKIGANNENDSQIPTEPSLSTTPRLETH
ncbi:MAG: ATP-binding protein, partial [Candidatus Bathyarchaeota archaeon]|nr:ATP-binding protein [Candidatus Bathyarchaeota archaeon]